MNAQRLVQGYTDMKYWGAGGEVYVAHMSSTPKPWEEGGRRSDIDIVWCGVYAKAMIWYSDERDKGGGSGGGSGNGGGGGGFREAYKRARGEGLGAKEAMERAKRETEKTKV